MRCGGGQAGLHDARGARLGVDDKRLGSGLHCNGGRMIITQEIIISVGIALSAYVTADLIWWVLERLL
jgi:hypothetical protein